MRELQSGVMPIGHAASVAAGQPDPRVAFVLELGRAVHRNGMPSHQIEDTLTLVAQTLGLEVQLFSHPTSIFAAFGPQASQHTFLLRVEPGAIQLDHQARLERLVTELTRGTLTLEQARARLDAIAVAPSPYPRPLVLLAFGVASAAACRFLGGGVREITAAAIAGLAIGTCAAVVGRGRLRRVFEPIAAGLAAAISGALVHVVGPFSVYTSTLAGLIVLIPGLELSTAMTELANRHLASGTARLNGALMTFLTIALGVAFGTSLVERLLGPAPGALPLALPGWTEGVALVIAPLAIMTLLDAPVREAPGVLLTSVLAFVGGRFGAAWLGPELGIFVGALTAGIVSNLYGRARHRSPVVALVPALLLLVPGSVGFRSLALMLRSDVLTGVESAFRMTIMLAALVAGLLIANAVAPARGLTATLPARPPGR